MSKEQEKGFEDHFNEFAEDPEGVPAEEEVPTDEEPEGTVNEEEESEESDEPTSDEEADDDEPSDDEEEPPAESGSDEPESSEDFMEDPEKVKQRYKTLQGMWNSEKAKREELERKLNESPDPEPQGDPEPKGQEQPTGEVDMGWFDDTLGKNDAFKEFKEEFPEVADAVSSGMQDVLKTFSIQQDQMIKTVLGNFAQAIQPMLSNYSSSEEERHLNEIKNAHEDFQEYVDSGEVEAWIAQQPPRKQAYYTEVYQQGSAGEVIELFDDFKDAMGYRKETPTAPPAQNGDKQRKLKNMASVPSKSTPVKGGKNVGSDKNDYAGAFEEALKS